MQIQLSAIFAFLPPPPLITFAQVLDAIYSLMCVDPVPRLLMQKVESLFSSMDTNKDGVVDQQEFTLYCKQNELLVTGMASLP